MLSIGTVSLTSPLILAPLAGYSDLAFRLLCREYGACLCVSEMISCHGLIYRQDRTLRMLTSCSEDKPVSFQLFGAEPAIMGEAAAYLSSFKPDIIDINMGCPVKKVTKRGAGAALMTDIRLAEKIVASVVASSSCPVTIKMRSGPDSKTINASEYGRMAEANGVAGLTVHGRNWKQAFSGTADWHIVRQVKEAVTIPVIGNGDIVSHEQALKLLAAGCCDGVMIGRGALGNPWIFHPDDKPASLEAIAEGALKHLTLYERYCGEEQPRLSPIKNHLGRYFKSTVNSSRIRQAIYQEESWNALLELLRSLL